MNDLDSRARAVVEAAQDADDPSPADRDRIRHAVMVHLAVGAAASTAVAGSMTVGMKLGLAALAVSLVGGGTAGVVHWQRLQGAASASAHARASVVSARGPTASPVGIWGWRHRRRSLLRPRKARSAGQTSRAGRRDRSTGTGSLSRRGSARCRGRGAQARAGRTALGQASTGTRGVARIRSAFRQGRARRRTPSHGRHRRVPGPSRAQRASASRGIHAFLAQFTPAQPRACGVHHTRALARRFSSRIVGSPATVALKGTVTSQGEAS